MQAYSLREKIAAIVKEARLGLDRAPATTFADRILAIPELQKLLVEPPSDTLSDD